jgi:hypothetical protein
MMAYASSRGKIAVLLPNGWLYGVVSRGEFSKAIGTDERYSTFRLSKQSWKGGRSVVTVKGSHVSAWDWLTPEPPARRKKAAKPAAKAPDPVYTVAEYRERFGVESVPNLTPEQRVCLAEDIGGLSEETIAMLCIAANVNTVDDLTQHTLPAFREALAAHVAGAVA